MSRNNLSNSEVANNMKNVRTSSQVWFEKKNNPIFEKISKKVSKKTNLPIENQEKIQILNYQPGQFYKHHFDNCLSHDSDCNKLEKGTNERKITTFIYLNDVEDGGETSFNNIGIKVKPKKGMAIFWSNLSKDNGDEFCSLHEALPVIKGEKWALTIWSRIKKFTLV